MLFRWRKRDPLRRERRSGLWGNYIGWRFGAKGPNATFLLGPRRVDRSCTLGERRIDAVGQQIDLPHAETDRRLNLDHIVEGTIGRRENATISQMVNQASSLLGG